MARLSGRTRLLLLLVLLPLALGLAWLQRLATAAPSDGPGGPILVVTSPTSTYGTYYAEILRTEGLNAFAVADIGAVSAATLAAYDVVVLAPATLSTAQRDMFASWVNAGGNLVAMRPDANLHGLLGIASAGGTLADRYLLVDTGAAPGAGIVDQTIQYHGTADRYTLAGATPVATLYSDAGTPTVNPAVTLRSVGTGHAAAFAYDLATSVVQTRQGRPAWATQERDGFPPIRPDDKFYGAATGDVQPDWIDLSKASIPQADEQQRLLANLIVHVNELRKPLPRFWYLPFGKKAAVIMSGDDHGNGGTAGRFDQFIAASPANCSVQNWECVRGTSYVYPNSPLTNAQAQSYHALGFEVGLHVNTSCRDFDLESLQTDYSQQLSQWTTKYFGIPVPATQRHHCIVWSDWATGAQVQLANGMRLDTSYYYWPPSWVQDRPGLFTGSAMPMRFAALDGQIIDVYMAVTQMTDESGQSYPLTIDTLLDRAIGPLGYYGVYTVNAHTDYADSDEADAVVASAKARGVPIVSSRQMLTWLDARNDSSFGSLSWNGSTLSFTVSRAPNANGLQGMLPARSNGQVLTGLTRGTTNVAFTVSVIKGVEYAFFDAVSGNYTASYGVDTTPAVVTSTTPAGGATGVDQAVTVAAVFSEPVDPTTVNGSTFQLRTAAGASVAASVSYDTGTRTALLRPSAALAAATTYTAEIRGGATEPTVRDLGGMPVTGLSWSFTTGSGPNCPCTVWDASATPATASANDPNGVELGVKFRSDLAGVVNGIRFYKGSANTGTHVISLWTTGGQRLATATVNGETATGWQEASFAAPVAITANTVYIASYYAPNGGYSINYDFFASAGVDRAPLHLLRDGESGGNGVYTYGATSSFPTSTYRSANYWIDVSFTASGSGPDTTPPTVTGRTPAAGATGVAQTTAVTATFSEAIDASTLSASTFSLSSPTTGTVAATLSYASATRTATLTPNAPLAAGTTFTATLRGGGADPRIKDLAGNALAADVSWTFTTGSAGGACANPANPVVAENCLPGNPPSEWEVAGIGDSSIQGFATRISVAQGETVQFKVDTPASNYRFDIYRLGYYGGQGARRVATVQPSASLPQNQPNCLTQSSTGLVDCGNWAVSGSWTVPATATSGIYIARLVRADTGGASHVVFVVRDDARASELLFQTADTTWQAYNDYGGASLYSGGVAGVGRAYKVSYNRPFHTRAVDNGQDWLFNAEYPMLRWLEANGYDVSYTTGVDSDLRGSLLLNHRVFLSVGHDEYWSGTQRANVEAARNAGVHLAFLSGNEVFWKTRWEPSIDASATPHRTLVSYKETHANAKIDPSPLWTGTWRDPRFSPPSDGGRPENGLTGTLFMVNAGATTAIRVPAEDGKMRLWRSTSVAALSAGQTAVMPNGTLGYEWDVDADNLVRPPGLFRLSTTTVTGAPVLQDYGSTYSSGTATHALTMYRHASGALVFGAGTVQWSWGLDSNHDRGSTAPDVRMQQATLNLFADMGAQPATMQAGLVAATASADATAPSSVITSPAANASITPGSTVTISGTATDAGGGVVGGVEVSTDNGVTWRRANGRGTWSASWTAPAGGTVTLRSRAVDDSGNIETPGAGVTVTVGTGDTTAPTIAARTPAPGATGVASNANVLVTFSEAMNATTVNTATVELRDAAGTLVSAGVTYDAALLRATLDPAALLTGGATYTATVRGGASGVKDAAGNALAADSSWSFTVAAGDTTAPTITVRSPAPGATGVASNANVLVTFSEAMDPASIGTGTVELRNAAGTLVSAGVTYDAALLRATLDPAALLTGGATYTATVRGGASGVKDAAGNALAADSSWSFTVAAGDTTAPTITARSPAPGATGVATNANVLVTFSEAMDPASIGTGTVELRNAAGTLVSASVTYDAALLRATLDPAALLTGGATYTATVRGGASGVKDAAGNALAADSGWSFTVVAGDTTAPTITVRSPAPGATGVARNANVLATFSEAMNATTINTGTMELRDAAGNLVSAVVSYSATALRATLNPDAALAFGATYTVTVKGGAAGVKDAAGNALAADDSWSFTVIPDTTAPTVSSVTPAAGATGVSRTVNVRVTFSEAMDPATLNTQTFVLTGPSGVVPVASISLSSNGRTATLDPSVARLNSLTVYAARVVGGSAGAKDLAGNPLAQDFSWSFTTRQ